MVVRLSGISSILLNQGPIPEIFTQKMSIGEFERLWFFELAIFEFFFISFSNENQSKGLGYQGWDKILMITLVLGQKSHIPSISVPSVLAKQLLTTKDDKM